MTPYDEKRDLTIKILRIVLGVVVFIELSIIGYNYQEVSTSGHNSLPSQFILVLAGFEIIGAVLFLIPRTVKIGSYVLPTVFLIVIIIHILHSQYDVGGLLIYTAAVKTVVKHQPERK